jgi:hypothetical protein
MPNTDRPNGFYPVYSLSGNIRTIDVPVATTQTLAAGDAVYLSSGQVTIATSTTGQIWGVMAEPSVTQAANTMVKVYPADATTVFEGQCSGNSARSLVGTSVDIEGTTGIMEVNEDATTELVVRIIELNPNDTIGANGRVRFIWARSAFNDYQDAE